MPDRRVLPATIMQSDHAERDDPATEPSPGASEVRRDGDDHRGRLGETNAREARRGGCSEQRVGDVRPGADREPHDDDAENGREHE